MTTGIVRGRKSLPFLATERRDAWWISPLTTFAVLGSFIVYATWAALQGDHYTYGPYLSPFYSPELFGASSHALFGPKPSWWPAILPFSPAILILWAPAGFRTTCYYYRGAYYKGMWADPPACAVGEPRKSYWGESSLPLILQNLHRYFLYLALVFLVFLAWDAVKATQFSDGFGIGVGTLVLTANVVLLSCYTFGCHSFRHLIGGGRDTLPKGLHGDCYRCVTRFNKRHQLFAWFSLFGVALSDVYVRLCSMGVMSDLRIF
ncbi:MAG: succinate dehydrogenase [Deltaproteobacteria bacterium]|nr:succinate dehydrogenase [Deltaproteobacteria bacterium]